MFHAIHYLFAAIFSLGAFVALSEAGPQYAPGTAHDTTTCGTTATLIDPGQRHYGGDCQNNSATEVFIGGSGVTTSAYGGKVCNDAATCLTGRFLAPTDMYCVVAAGTQDVTCNFAVAP